MFDNVWSIDVWILSFINDFTRHTKIFGYDFSILILVIIVYVIWYLPTLVQPSSDMSVILIVVCIVTCDMLFQEGYPPNTRHI